MPQIFSWFPDASTTKDSQPRIATARFGDGYEQRAAMGINHIEQAWQLTFTGGSPEINAIENFLTEHGGVTAFEWTTPEEVTGYYVCRSWSKRRDRGVKNSLTCKFERVYAP